MYLCRAEHESIYHTCWCVKGPTFMCFTNYHVDCLQIQSVDARGRQYTGEGCQIELFILRSFCVCMIYNVLHQESSLFTPRAKQLKVLLKFNFFVCNITSTDLFLKFSECCGLSAAEPKASGKCLC